MANDVAQRKLCPNGARCIGPMNCDAAGNCQHPPQTFIPAVTHGAELPDRRYAAYDPPFNAVQLATRDVLRAQSDAGLHYDDCDCSACIPERCDVCRGAGCSACTDDDGLPL